VRFKPSNVLVERGAALVRTCVSSDTPTTVVPLSLPGEPAREFLSSLRTPETSRSANFFWQIEGSQPSSRCSSVRRRRIYKYLIQQRAKEPASPRVSRLRSRRYRPPPHPRACFATATAAS